jgi:hypothetical protein
MAPGRDGRPRGPAVAGALVAALVMLCGCGADAPDRRVRPPFTNQTIKTAFISPADLGKGAVQFEDSGHGSHVIYTPPDTVPTCPYVQRADDAAVTVQPALQLDGGNPTGRFVVGPADPAKTPLPVVTQGAVVFPNDTLTDQGMRAVTAESAKCPASFTILGGPPVIVGGYRVTRRPIEVAGWKGFAQHLVHTSPPQVNSVTYDDLVTAVVRKANAIVYAGFEQTRKTGERSDSADDLEDLLKDKLKRMG